MADLVQNHPFSGPDGGHSRTVGPEGFRVGELASNFPKRGSLEGTPINGVVGVIYLNRSGEELYFRSGDLAVLVSCRADIFYECAVVIGLLDQQVPFHAAQIVDDRTQIHHGANSM